MTTTAERAFRENFALNFVASLGEHLHLDRAVIKQHRVTDADVVDEILVVHIHGMFFLTALATHRQGELLSRLQIQRHREIASADGWPLRIHQDADVQTALSGSRANNGRDLTHPVMRRVRHVETKDIHARVNQRADHFGRTGGGSERGYDFCFSHEVLVQRGEDIQTRPDGKPVTRHHESRWSPNQA